MKLFDRAAALLYPGRCISCRNTTDGGRDVLEKCFCSRCAQEFRESCRAVCRACGRPHYQCECLPDALFRVGISKACACFSYNKRSRASSTSRFIFSLKDTGDKRSFELAKMLLSWRIASSGILDDKSGGELVITYVPRGRINVRVFGEDHMRRVACETASFLNVGAADLFVNSSRGEQKGRDAKERGAAARSSFSLRPGADVKGKRVIIIDDIITSGASAAVCASLLTQSGAACVYVFALAKTRRESPARKLSELAT